MLSTPLFKEEASLVDPAAPSDLSQAKPDTDLTSESESRSGKENSSHLKKLLDYAENVSGGGGIENFSTVSGTVSPADVNGYAQQQQPVNGSNDGGNLATSLRRTDGADQDHGCLLAAHADQALISAAAVSGGGSGIEPRAEGGEDDDCPVSPGRSEPSKSAHAHVACPAADQQDKKTGGLFCFSKIVDLFGLFTQTVG